MADFNQAFDRTVKLEGGYSTDRGDSGNYTGNSKKSGKFVGTKFGVSAIAYQEAFKKVPTVADMKDITKDDARKVYKALFWDKIKGDFIKDQQVAEIVFDHAINTYPPRAVRLINNTFAFFKEKVKGLAMDAEKLTLINNLPPKDFFNLFKKQRIAYYIKNAKKKHVKGLLNRVNKFKYA